METDCPYCKKYSEFKGGFSKVMGLYLMLVIFSPIIISFRKEYVDVYLNPDSLNSSIWGLLLVAIGVIFLVLFPLYLLRQLSVLQKYKAEWTSF